MNKDIVILSGSPRKGGNTEKLAAAFKEGAESVGNSVTVFGITTMKIEGCIGCEFCLNNPGKCTHKDDMPKILDALYKADVVVWASPVYYFSVTAQLKAVIDRTYPLINDNTKQAVLLLTCADESSDTAEGALAIYHKTVDYYKWKDAGVIIAAGVEHMGDIDGHTALVEAIKLGQGF